jgi:hypothetical protein
MVTLIRVHDGFMSEHEFAHGSISIGRGDIIQNRMSYEADTFVSRNDAIIIHSVDGLLHLYNNNRNVIRVFHNTQIHRVRPRETVALNTHDRVRLCPKDDADGIHYTDFQFVLNLTDVETQSPPWESLGEDESLPLPLSYEEGQVESLPLSLP